MTVRDLPIGPPVESLSSSYFVEEIGLASMNLRMFSNLFSLISSSCF